MLSLNNIHWSGGACTSKSLVHLVCCFFLSQPPLIPFYSPFLPPSSLSLPLPPSFSLLPPPPPPHTLLRLQYLLCGLAEINVDDWRKYTVYANGYNPNDDAIIWFWKVQWRVCRHIVQPDMRPYNITRLLLYYMSICNVHVAFPCRNRRLFRHILWLQCLVWNAVSLNLGWGSYICCVYVDALGSMCEPCP